jgi:hypothetical protein
MLRVMFRGRDRGGNDRARDQVSGEQVFQGLRGQLLSLDPAEAGLDRFTADRRVLGALMETGYPTGTATLVALADGTTSLYTSTGGDIIGGGGHARVAAASRSFLTVVVPMRPKTTSATAGTHCQLSSTQAMVS